MRLVDVVRGLVDGAGWLVDGGGYHECDLAVALMLYRSVKPIPGGQMPNVREEVG